MRKPLTVQAMRVVTDLQKDRTMSCVCDGGVVLKAYGVIPGAESTSLYTDTVRMKSAPADMKKNGHQGIPRQFG